MVQIEVISEIPEQMPGNITAWINLGEKRPLARRATLEAHPAWEDAERRRAAGAITSAYLTASPSPILILPGEAAKHFPEREKVKTLAADALATAQERKCASLVFLLDGPAGSEMAADVAEGLAISSYRFTKYKKEDKPQTPPHVSFVVDASPRNLVRGAVKARLDLCGSVNRARDLINEPGSVATPAEVEARARKVAKASGLKITVLDAKQLKKEGYEGLLSVGRGGNVPPRMIILGYNPKGAKGKTHLGLLGKGVTFDTGGVSIKPAAKMWEMKGDMSGAAAVLYGMEAIAAIKPKVRVT
ncbi:hypothetical protein HY256_04430, partial [Candidatus Sumerlaeota bacterium]|nr:hypothetical protein [Candidatus Sumerlaeota bacterium]